MPETDRITEVFENAKTIDFDDSSKLILISDCHRGDDSWADDLPAMSFPCVPNNSPPKSWRYHTTSTSSVGTGSLMFSDICGSQ
jgi:hypothetical protein